jgi:RHS repeat-associated protein
VYEAIMAQESNFSQASWHAPKGMAGDPLIADYYGSGGGIASINYAGADCGYGIGQVTTGMHVGDGSISAHGQIKVAVDYQENIAAGLQILENSWNKLYSDGILANNADPKYLENWYFAAWAYNSGIQPTSAYNNTGCTPGPTCTGPDGTWGLGWANNPENPSYPPNRTPYLKSTYADAAHPGSWPYQERVMGWIGSPIVRYSVKAYNAPTYQGGQTWLQIPPFTTFCTVAGNQCDPVNLNTSNPVAGHCQLNDYECWWHGPATWVASCSTTCATSAYEFGSGSTEPANPDPNPPTCNIDRSVVPSSAIIVDDQASPPTNIQGCSGENWSSNGTFTYSPGTNAAGDPIGNIDTHQLGAGLGGHILFTHTQDGTNPSEINTGTWTPSLPSLQYYTVKLHLPALGAKATNVTYTINPGGSATPWKIRVNQAWNSEQWVTIGTFAMQNGANVVLTNQSTSSDTSGTAYASYDVAYDAVAFVPMGGTPGTPIGGPPTVQDEPKGSNPAWVQCNCGSRTAGDPVDTATGYFGETLTDLATPGRGAALDFTRTYTGSTADPAGPNGSSAVNGPFGYGWTFSYNLAASTDAGSGAVTIHQEDGSQVAFTDTGGTYTTTEPRNDATLTASGTTYTYTRHGRNIFLFDSTNGHLTSVQDLPGAHASTPYATNLAYNASGQLSTITDPDGRVYTLTWTADHITGLADSAGRTITYSYDASSDLTDVLGVGTTRTPSVLDNDHTQYGYAPTTHVMTSMRGPNNFAGPAGAVTAMTYDTSERVITQTDAVGRLTTFAYGPSSSPSLVAGQTLVTDPAGHQVLDTYDNGLLTSETRGYTSPTPSTWTYTYDPLTLGVSTESNPDGKLSTFSYDDHGNPTSASDADGRTTSYAHDGAGDTIETIDPTGVATVNLYDQAGHISTGAGTTNDGTFTYGDLTSSTTTQANNITESTTGNFGPAPTRTTNFYYDTAGDPADQTRIVDPANNTTTSAYDGAGDLASVTDPLGRKSLRSYDTTRGWLTSTVTATGTAAGTLADCAPPATGCATFAHDAYGHVTVTTDPLAHTTKASFDADGNTTSTTDGDNNTTATTFDVADQPTTTTGADTSTTATTYNGDGTTATVKDAAGDITTYGYDGQGRRITATDPDTRVTTTGYDPAGHTITAKDPAGSTTTDTVDDAGQVTAITYSDGITPNVSAIGYDPDGRPTSMIDGTGASTWSYDTFGDLTSSVNGAGASMGYGYDARGNTTTITYPDAKTVTNTYDAVGQLTGVKDSASNRTGFGYNADGVNTTLTYPNGTKVTNGFNTANQQTSTTLTNGATTLAAITYGRDNAGQVSSRSPTGTGMGTAQTYSYTPLQQVKTDTAGSYAYDAANNPTALNGATQKFDAANQLCWSTTAAVTGTPTCATPPTGSTTYTLNTDGERTASTPATGTASGYSYDQAAELTNATTAAGTGAYTYNGAGLRTSKTVGGVNTGYTWGTLAGANVLLTDGATDYIYGPGKSPIEQTNNGICSYLVHDQLGSTIALTGAAGTVVGTYTYTTSGGTLTHTGTIGTPLQYGGGYTDSETALIYLQARYYDPTTGQFLTVDPLVAATGARYSYAGGNPLTFTDPTGLWPTIVIGAVIGAVVGTLVSTASYALSPGEKSWRGLAGAAAGGLVSGGITGACLGTGVGLLASAACGAAGGAAGSMASQWVGGGSINDWGAVGTDTAFGAVVGGGGGLLSEKLGLELTQGQIRSWSNLRNSDAWLPGRIASNYWKNSWLGGLIDGPRSVIYNYLTC